MAIDIDTWRASIGVFCPGESSGVKCFKYCYDGDDLKFHGGRRKWAYFLFNYHLFHRIPRGYPLSIIATSFLFQCLLLILCGDIHPNPGPPEKVHCETSLCHANMRSLKQLNNDGMNEKVLSIECELANSFDIITISETWLTENDLDTNLIINGYQNPFRRDRQAQNGTIGYGGVLAWVSNTIACKRRSDLEQPDIEAMWLEIRSNNNKFLLCVAYRAPGMQSTIFWDKMQESVNLINSHDKLKILIAGDLNADPDTPAGVCMSDFVRTNEMHIHINEPTRITHHSQTILDQFISNVSNFVQSPTVRPPILSSDHCVISASLSFKLQKGSTYSRRMWNFKESSFDDYRAKLSSHNWEHCTEPGLDINEAVNSWTRELLSIAESTIPNRMVIIRVNDKPWYSTFLRKLRRKKDKLHLLAKRGNTFLAWQKFREQRNLYYLQISKAKNEHDEKLYSEVNEGHVSSKKWWSLIKTITKSKCNNSFPPLSVGDDILTNDLDKANAFNNYFMTASSIDDSNASVPETNRLFAGGFENLVVTTRDVNDQLKCLDTSKSFGPDLISPRFLKEGSDILAEPLCKIINNSLSQKVVPTAWKRANVIPIHKKGKRELTENYRPVSLLSTVSKVMERTIFKHVYNYFNDNFIISQLQSGFLPGRSTVTQLLEVYHHLCSSINSGKEVRVVFLDISKAFDKVWHPGLLYKLEMCGIRGNLLAWFKSYLSDRFQRVMINGQASEWSSITAGVPQGSVLGPLLFLIYINDIVNTVSHCKIRMFADDTCLFLEVDDRDAAAALVNEDLNAIYNWSKSWLIQFSAPKTKSLTISNKTDRLLNPVLKFNSHPIEEVKSHVYLGVRLSCNLHWSAHICDISLKARQKLNMLMYFKFKLSRRSLEIMYESFILPTMEYANIVWGGTINSDLAKLENIHEDAMRCITGATARSNIANLYTDTQWYCVKDRISNNVQTMMFKINNNLVPLYLKELLPIPKVVNYNLRNRHDLQPPLCRLKLFERSFIPTGIRQWNMLPENLQTLPSVESFKQNSRNKERILLYYYGKRWSSIHHARMRIGCSKLNYDLCNNLHVIENMSCSCGAPIENAQHFFLMCPLFANERQILMQSLTIIHNNVQCNDLLFGINHLSLELNQAIFHAVQEFIVKTKRFV